MVQASAWSAPIGLTVVWLLACGGETQATSDDGNDTGGGEGQLDGLPPPVPDPMTDGGSMADDADPTTGEDDDPSDTTASPTTGPGDSGQTTDGGESDDTGDGSATGTGTDEGTTGSPMIGPGLVINEIGYDDPGLDTDGLEFIEIHNGTGAAVPLAGLQLYFVNANGANYAPGDPLALSAAGDTLPDDAYLVIADDPATLGITAGASLLVLDLGGAGNQLQNGSDDGLVLWDTDQDLALDSVVYDGAPFTASDIDGQMDAVTVGETAGAPADPAAADDDAIGRDAASTDTDDNSADFTVVTASPGAANP